MAQHRLGVRTPDAGGVGREALVAHGPEILRVRVEHVLPPDLARRVEEGEAHPHGDLEQAPLLAVGLVDEAGGDRYREMAAASIAAHGGRYVVRGALPEALEGAWADDTRLVIVEFPTVEAARTWYSSADYAEALALSRTVLQRRLLLAEGVGEGVS